MVKDYLTWIASYKIAKDVSIGEKATGKQFLIKTRLLSCKTSFIAQKKGFKVYFYC